MTQEEILEKYEAMTEEEKHPLFGTDFRPTYANAFIIGVAKAIKEGNEDIVDRMMALEET